MKHNRVFLKHILDEIDFLTRETEGKKFEEFIENEVLKRACSRSLEIIGEAVRNLSADVKKQHKEIEWKKISGLRDKMIYGYFGVNWDIVWDVMRNQIPKLRTQVEDILDHADNENT